MKQYILTKVEIEAIMEALDAKWYQIKKHEPRSQAAIDRKKAIRVLLDQFKNDYSLLRR